MASTDLARYERLAKQAKVLANQHEPNSVDAPSSSDALKRWTIVSMQSQVARALRDLQSSAIPPEEREKSNSIQSALLSAQQSLQQQAQVRLDRSICSEAATDAGTMRLLQSVRQQRTWNAPGLPSKSFQSIYASLAEGLDDEADDDDDSQGPSSGRGHPAQHKNHLPSDSSVHYGVGGVSFLARPKIVEKPPMKDSNPVRIPPAGGANGDDGVLRQRYVAKDSQGGDMTGNPSHPDDELAAEYGVSAEERRSTANPESNETQHAYPPQAGPNETPSGTDSTVNTLLQSSRGIQDSLSGELLRMASILRKNTEAFADALERDRKLIEVTGEQLAGNLDLMTRTRGRLGEYSRKARGLGWFTLGCILMVIVAWVWVFVLIKLT